jgi:hypothetical protein
MTAVGPVTPPLPAAPTPTATTGAQGAVGLGATPNPSAPTMTQAAVQALTAIVVNLPNTLRHRPVGSPITGTLVAQDSSGNALLRTPEGTVVLRGPVAAQVGSQMALYLSEQGEGASARLVVLRLPDGGVPGGVTAGSAAQTTAPSSSGSSAAAELSVAPRPALAAPAPGQVVTATLVQRGESPPAPGSGIAAGYARVPLGAAFETRILSVGQAAAGAPTMGVDADGNPVVTATVVGRTSSGLLAVNAGFGLLTLPLGGDLQPGQLVQLALLGRPGASAPSPAPIVGQAATATLVERGDTSLAAASRVAHDFARAPVGTAIAARIVAVADAAEDGAATGSIALNARGNPVVTATVTGRSPAGLPMIDAGFGMLAVTGPGGLQPGQRVQIELVGRAGPAPGALAPGQVVTATLLQRAEAPAPAGLAPGYARAAAGAMFDARVVSVTPASDAPAGNTATMGVNASGHPVVTATVIGRAAAGAVVVNAGFGLLALQSDGEVEPGTRLQLELIGRVGAPAPAPPPPTARPATVTLVQRGVPPPPGASPIVATLARAPIGTALEARIMPVATAEDGASPGTVQLGPQGQPIVTAVVARRAGPGPITVNAGFGLLAVQTAATLAPGQRVQIELLGRPGENAAPLAPGQVVTATLVQRSDGPPAGTSAQGYARAAIGAAFAVRVVAIGAGGAPAPGAMTSDADGHPVVTATVVGRTAAGLLAVNAGFGLLTIPAGGALEPGQPIQLALLARPPGTAAAAPPLAGDAAAKAADAASLAHDWETLRRTLEVLAAGDPQAAQQAQGRAVALPGERLAAGLLFLIAALRGGDVSMLLGERAVRALERAGRGAMLARLSEELGTLRRLATEPSGDWRAFFLPVQQPDGPITPVRLFFRQQRGRKGQGEPTTRFVVETELTRLGPLQIDGLARATRIDLVLRTRELLPEGARRDIDAIVQSAAAEGRFTGTIAFQAVTRFPIDPLDEIAHPAQQGVTA